MLYGRDGGGFVSRHPSAVPRNVACSEFEGGGIIGVRCTHEDSPARIADFQSAFIQSVTGLGDADRLTKIRGVIESAYQQAVRDGLTASKVPVEGLQEWALRREELDRWATKEVQGMFTAEERRRFDQAFIGVMGIDLGVGDGNWFRFPGPNGSVVFPSEGDPQPSGEQRSPESP
jgi:hypothetical protein